MLIGKWNKSVIMTYIGLCFCVFGIYEVMNGGNVLIILSCLLLAGICDMFDGLIARGCDRTLEEKHFGIELDSLVDTASFVIFPIIIYLYLGFNEWYHLLSFMMFSICGIARLGYFNIGVDPKGSNEPIKCYTGLPVTCSAFIFPICYLFSYLLSETGFMIFFSILMPLVAILNITKLKVPKLKSKKFYVLVCLLSVFIISLLFIFK